MKLRFEIDQAESFRRGIDRPKSIVSIEVNPADVPEEARSLIADHLAGIDVLKLFYHNGEVIRGFPIMELLYTSREPQRIVASAANLEALVEGIKANDKFIKKIQDSFDRPVQFRLIDKPPKNESDFQFISDQREAQVEDVYEAVRQKRRVCFQGFLHDIQTKLNRALHANSYRVFLLPIPGLTAQGRFYCEPVFAAEYMKRTLVAHSPTIVLNEKTGAIIEARSLFEAIDVYLFSSVRSGTLADDLSILTFENDRWIIVSPEELINIANDAQAKANGKSGDI